MLKILLFIRRYILACILGLILTLVVTYALISGPDKLIVWLKDDAIKDAIKYMFSGLAGAGVLLIGERLKAYTQISDRDFEITIDKSTLSLTPERKSEGLVFKVEVERIFSMSANKSGVYTFKRECKGMWLGPESTLCVGKQSYGLNTSIPHLITAQESIQVRGGMLLDVRLKSIEIIPAEQGHYSLSIGSFIKESNVQWHSSAATDAGMQAYLYGESIPVRKQCESISQTIADAKEGFNLLILWNKEQS